MAYYIGYRKIKPSKKQIWDILEWLRDSYKRDDIGIVEEPMITTTKTKAGIIITIKNL